MSALPAFPPPLRSYVSDFVARDRRVCFVRTLGICAALALACLLTVCVADRLLALPAWARLALLVASIAGALFPIARLIWRTAGGAVDWVAVAMQIESRDPLFGERLETVTSQLLAPQQYRGSDEILRQLLDDVVGRAAGSSAAGLVSWRPATRPWAIAGGLLVVGFALGPIAWLNLPRLLQRAIRPMAGIPAVSVAQLDVRPRGAEVQQGASLTIRAYAARLGAKPVVLCLSGDGRSWSRAEMQRETPIPPATAPVLNLASEFTFTLPGVDRDLRYYVRAADAVSDIYNIRVKRVPAVAEFRIHYTYPASTRRVPLNAANTEGYVEAPAGARAEIRIAVTEPLAGASLITDVGPIALAPTPDPEVWETTLTVERDMTCALELTSAQGVASSRLAVTVHALPDRPPLVRLLQPSQDLLLAPRDVVRMRYEAIDDYGIAALAVRTSVNGGPAIVDPVHVRGDAVRVEGEFRLDLAALGLRVGDLVWIAVRAQDSAEQTTSIDVPRRIWIVPGAVDQRALRRVGELKSAALLATAWVEQLARAKRAWEALLNAGPGAPSRQELLVKANHASADAAETAGELRLALLRAAANDRPAGGAGGGMAGGIASLADAAALIVASSGGARDADRVKNLGPAADRAQHDLVLPLNILWQGESAALRLIERSDFRTLDAIPVVERREVALRRRQSVDALRQTMNAAIVELGLNPGAGDLDFHLQQRVDAARSTASSLHTPDFIAAANEWSPRRDPVAGALLAQRLELAAAVRGIAPPGDAAADLAWARDLQLGARAVSAIVAGAPPPGNPREDEKSREARLRSQAQQFPGLLDSMRRDDESLRGLDPARSPEPNRRSSHTPAADARLKLAAWAGEPDLAGVAAPDAARLLESLAFDASAESAVRNHDRAVALDRVLADGVAQSSKEEAARLKQALERLTTVLRELERLIVLQEKLRAETDAGQPAALPAIAARQRDLAGALERLPRPGAIWAEASGETSAGGDSAREALFAALTAAPGKLAALRQATADAEPAAAELHDLAQRAVQQHSPATTGPAHQASTRAAAELTAGKQKLSAAVKAIDAAARAVDETLRPAEPEVDGELEASHLRPAIAALLQATAKVPESGDAGPVNAAAQQVRSAADDLQRRLQESRPALIARYPLPATKALARLAGEALLQSPADARAAAGLQRETTVAMRLAWHQALARSAALRLEVTPSFASAFEWPAEGETAALVGNYLRYLLGARGPRKPGERNAEASNPSEADPPAYKDAVKAYFDTLAHARDEKGKR